MGFNSAFKGLISVKMFHSQYYMLVTVNSCTVSTQSGMCIGAYILPNMQNDGGAK